MNEPALICAFSTASLAIKMESDEILVSCFLTHLNSQWVKFLLTLQPLGRATCQLAWNRCSSLLTTGQYSRCTFDRGSKSLELGTLGCPLLARTSWIEILVAASKTFTKMLAFSSTERWSPSDSEIALNCLHRYPWLQHPFGCHLPANSATSYLKDPYLVRDYSCVGGLGKAQHTSTTISAPRS